MTGSKMQIFHLYPRAGKFSCSVQGIKDDLVDGGLNPGKTPVCRIGTYDIRCISLILIPCIYQIEIPVFYFLVVLGAVSYGAVSPLGVNPAIGCMQQAKFLLMVLEQILQFIFIHSLLASFQYFQIST